MDFPCNLKVLIRSIDGWECNPEHVSPLSGEQFNFLAYMFGKWEGAGEGGGDGVQYMHRTVVVLDNEIHLKFFLPEIQQLGSDSRRAPLFILALADVAEQVGGKRHQVAPRVFLDFLPGEPFEIEIGGQKETGLAE